jgi:hypothetical protein
VSRARRVGGADRVDPQLLAKFASKIDVSSHAVEASEDGRRPSAILPGVDATRRDEYRRRQRRRAIIAWTVFGLVVVIVGSSIAFTHGGSSTTTTFAHIFPSEMTSGQYEELHKGQGETVVLRTIGNPGLAEDEVEEVDLLRTFPPRPSGSFCNFWTLSDAPDHLVRLCFDETAEVLEQKSVRAPGESAAETTLT